jgi:hypothetical protein
MNYGAIRSILLTVILLTASWAAFGAISGTAVSAILLASAAYLLVSESRWTRSIRVAAVVLGLLALVGLLVPAVKAARQAARCMSCQNNLKQIAIGVRTYHDHHGCYPLPCTRNEAGRPMHSWRVLVLPYLINNSIEYDLNEPWNSPGNRKVFAAYEHLYRCPTAQSWPPYSGTTNYVAVVGRRAARRHMDASQKDLDSQQQKADTFLIVETANSEIPWKEPKDIYVDDLPALQSLIANSPHRRSNGYFFHETPAMNAVLVDGDMMFMFPRDSTPNVLTSLMLLLPPDPTEAERRDTNNFLDRLYKEQPPPIHWPHSIGLPVWIVSFGLLFYQVTCSRKSRREAAKGIVS